MRRFALLLAIALTLIPRYLHATAPAHYKQAEKLAWEEHYEEALAMVTPLPIFADDRYYARQVLCLTYSLWGKNEEAMAECGRALENPAYKTALKCIDDGRWQKTIPNTRECNSAVGYPEISGVYAWRALATYRIKNLNPMAYFEFTVYMELAETALSQPGGQRVIFDAVQAYFRDTFKETFEKYRAAGQDTAALERLRIIFTYGGANTPRARILRSTRVFYTELPYAKHVLVTSVAIFIGAVLFVFRGPFMQLAGGVTSAGRNIPRRINAWLRPSARPAAPYSPAPASAPGIPLYYTMRYPNQAYRIASYCFATFWIVLLGPLSLALLLPAFTLLADFSTSGFQK